MKNDTFDDVRYFLLGLQIANTADIFVDKSAVEIYLQDGEIALSSRVYTSKDATDIELNCDNNIKIDSFEIHRLGKVTYNE